jgi:hypothetical protein
MTGVPITYALPWSEKRLCYHALTRHNELTNEDGEVGYGLVTHDGMRSMVLLCTKNERALDTWGRHGAVSIQLLFKEGPFAASCFTGSLFQQL